MLTIASILENDFVLLAFHKKKCLYHEMCLKILISQKLKFPKKQKKNMKN